MAGSGQAEVVAAAHRRGRSFVLSPARGFWGIFGQDRIPCGVLELLALRYVSVRY